MKIKNVSCKQFAGLLGRNVSFEDGINVIFGKNESGKSTVVNLLSRTLFQKARLDRRKDKDFYDLYFPSAKKGADFVGDFADGDVSVETENGTYILSKEWGTDARCTLSTPDGIIRDQDKIDEILKDILLYGEGVYSDMLFSSQKNTNISLQNILDSSNQSDVKKEIAVAVSQAFAESDGVSIDAIEQALNTKIEDIAGKHWDFERQSPVHKVGRWASGLGDILKAYYAYEDAKADLDEITMWEVQAENAANDYAKKDAEVCQAQEACDRFAAFSSKLTTQSIRKKNIERLESDLAKINDVLSAWPQLSESLEKAKVLKAENKKRELLDKYAKARNIADEIKTLGEGFANAPCPTESEITKIKSTQRNITMLENKLCGMNINAAVNMFGGHTAVITSLRTGEKIELSGSTASLTEAVKITVPDVLEMQLYPADVNVAEIEEKIKEQKSIVDSIFKKYNVGSLEALESLANDVKDAKSKLENANNRLEVVLGDTSFKELEDIALAIDGNIRETDEIESDIISVCMNLDIDRFITSKETVIAGYEADYGSINELKIKAYDISDELNKTKEAIFSAEDIPTEYLNISDPENYLKNLQDDLKNKQEIRENALNTKTSVTSKLETKQQEKGNSSDLGDMVEKQLRIYNEQKSLLNHWLHIKQVFEKQKENVHDNPMQDIADSFEKNLSIITAGRVLSEFPEADKLNMNIYSNDRLIDYGKLSEGTKETVSLAFRLAVLDHLFPEGGGVIVLDDPFTDMDAERTQQSCLLLKDCAKRHQVIFLTCKQEYLEMLGGNKICF